MAGPTVVSNFFDDVRKDSVATLARDGIDHPDQGARQSPCPRGLGMVTTPDPASGDRTHPHSS